MIFYFKGSEFTVQGYFELATNAQRLKAGKLGGYEAMMLGSLDA
jgi:hypothetical protein